MSGMARGGVAGSGWLFAVALVAALTTDTSSLHAKSRSHASLVLDANTGRVISQTDADELRYPASLTKMMTLYVLFEQIERRKLTYDTEITFSEAATRVQPSKIGIKAGETLSVRDAARALIVKSANDVAVAVAEHISGSEAKFAALMTQTARRIGMKSSVFKNAHGLPNDEQVTTARDMITLGLRLQDDFPEHYKLFSTRDFAHGSAKYRTHNTLLLTYEGTDGIKTGYIGASGFNLVANVKRGDKHVIGVVFGGATAGARNQTMKTLLNMALFKASPVKTRRPVAVARSAPPTKDVPAPAAIARPVPVEAPRQTAVAATAAPTGQLARSSEADSSRLAAKAPPVQIARVRQQVVASAPASAGASPMAPQTNTHPTSWPATTTATTAGSSALLPTGQEPPVKQAAVGRAPAAVQRLNGPAAPVATGGVHLQVGAYASKSDAERQLASVRQQGGAAVATLAGEAMAATANGKTVFRARFVGVDPTNAGTICNELRRRQIDCMVAKPD